jgi:hypothetical protein
MWSGDGVCDTGCAWGVDPDCGSSGGGAPTGWICDPTYYAAADGCDCGCGVADPDCTATGACTAAGCCGAAAPAACDYCW